MKIDDIIYKLVISYYEKSNHSSIAWSKNANINLSGIQNQTDQFIKTQNNIKISWCYKYETNKD